MNLGLVPWPVKNKFLSFENRLVRLLNALGIVIIKLIAPIVLTLNALHISDLLRLTIHEDNLRGVDYMLVDHRLIIFLVLKLAITTAFESAALVTNFLSWSNDLLVGLGCFLDITFLGV